MKLMSGLRSAGVKDDIARAARALGIQRAQRVLHEAGHVAVEVAWDLEREHAGELAQVDGRRRSRRR
jgi:hypothetical protein